MPLPSSSHEAHTPMLLPPRSALPYRWSTHTRQAALPGALRCYTAYRGQLANRLCSLSPHAYPDPCRLSIPSANQLRLEAPSSQGSLPSSPQPVFSTMQREWLSFLFPAFFRGWNSSCIWRVQKVTNIAWEACQVIESTIRMIKPLLLMCDQKQSQPIFKKCFFPRGVSLKNLPINQTLNTSAAPGDTNTFHRRWPGLEMSRQGYAFFTLCRRAQGTEQASSSSRPGIFIQAPSHINSYTAPTLPTDPEHRKSSFASACLRPCRYLLNKRVNSEFENTDL